jgi:hypothetical protein
VGTFWGYINKLSDLAKKLKAAGEEEKAKEFLGKVTGLLVNEESYKKLKEIYTEISFTEYIDDLLKLADQLTKINFKNEAKDEAKEFLGKVADLLVKDESYTKLAAEDNELGFSNTFLGYIDKLSSLAKQLKDADFEDGAQEFLGKVVDLLVKEGSYKKLAAAAADGKLSFVGYIDGLLKLADQLTKIDFKAKAKEKAQEFLGKVADLLVKEESYKKLAAEDKELSPSTNTFLGYINKLSSLAKQLKDAGEEEKAKEFLGKVTGLLVADGSYGKLAAADGKINFVEYIDGLLKLAGQLKDADFKAEAEKFLDQLQAVLNSKKDDIDVKPKYEEWSGRLEGLRKAIAPMT